MFKYFPIYKYNKKNNIFPVIKTDIENNLLNLYLPASRCHTHSCLTVPKVVRLTIDYVKTKDMHIKLKLKQ